MGLHAVVYCDCFERGKVRELPPQPELVYVEPSGQVSFKWDAPNADQHRFYDWLAKACDHGPMGELVFHRLGNISLIAFLREILSKTPERFPVLLAKVLYDGTHGGDYLGLEEVSAVAAEVAALRAVGDTQPHNEALIRGFERQMSELVEAAQRLAKPIAF